MSTLQNNSRYNVFGVRLAGFALSLLLAPLGSLAQQPPLQITSPVTGAKVSPGQTLAITVTSPSGLTFSEVDVIGENPLGMTSIASAVPAQFSLSIPQDIAAGSYQLTAEGTTTSGQDAQSSSVSIDIERSDLPTTLSSLMPSISLQQAAQTIPLIILGNFADGTVLDVSQSSYLRYRSVDSSVATVDNFGGITAVSNGTGLIVVSYGGGNPPITVSIPITVGSPSVAAGANFLLSMSPGLVTVVPGSTANYSVLADSSNGFPGTVQLSAVGLPPGVAASFVPQVLTVPGTAALAIFTSASTATGNYPFFIIGTSGAVSAKLGAALSVGPTPAPSIASLQPAQGTAGTSVLITGNGFGLSQGASTITFNGTAATATSWSDSVISALVPSGATSGSVVVTVGTQISNGVNFAVTSALAPSISVSIRYPVPLGCLSPASVGATDP